MYGLEISWELGHIILPSSSTYYLSGGTSPLIMLSRGVYILYFENFYLISPISSKLKFYSAFRLWSCNIEENGFLLVSVFILRLSNKESPGYELRESGGTSTVVIFLLYYEIVLFILTLFKSSYKNKIESCCFPFAYLSKPLID
jgi:peptidoglycan/LPS O-acetylase OafA/YrhL